MEVSYVVVVQQANTEAMEVFQNEPRGKCFVPIYRQRACPHGNKQGAGETFCVLIGSFLDVFLNIWRVTVVMTFVYELD